MATFYCLRFETSHTWRARFPYLWTPGTRWLGYIPRHWVPFSSPPTTRMATLEVFDPTSTRLLYYLCSREGIRRKHVHFLAMDVYCYSECASTNPLPSNGYPSIVEGLYHGNIFAESFPIHMSYLLTYLRSWGLLKKPPIVHLLKNFPAFYRTQRFITVFTRAFHWSLSWARSIQSIPSL
jgi:hypothetical protein